MNDNKKQSNKPVLHQGADNSAPYPVSRMAPSFELVDLAKSISEADTTLASHASNKLKLIAGQIKALQEEARKILKTTQRDQQLHRAQCNFKRQAGKIYHLYKKSTERYYFSLLAPQEWGGTPPHEYAGSYRLEVDMSWTPLEEIDNNESVDALIKQLTDSQ